MTEHKPLGDMIDYLKKDLVGEYKVSQDFSCSKVNRKVFWLTTFVAVVFVLSFVLQGHARETIMVLGLIPFVLIGVTQQIFWDIDAKVRTIQDSQWPEMHEEKGNKKNAEALKLFMISIDWLDVAKIERKVVWFASVKIWLVTLVCLSYGSMWQGILTLLAVLYATSQLTKAVYGVMAMYNMNVKLRQ